SFDGDFASIGELDGVADQIDQHLRQAAAVAMTRWQVGSHLNLESELLVGRQWLQRAANGLGDVLDRIIGEFEYELPGLDLGEIQNIVDETEQMPAVGLKAFEYAKHLLGRLAVGPVRHQFGVPQDRVERRAQFVAHISKELRFVLACLFKLPALVLDFVEQPHVLDGNHGLVSKSFNQLDLLRREWSRCGAP